MSFPSHLERGHEIESGFTEWPRLLSASTASARVCRTLLPLRPLPNPDQAFFPALPDFRQPVRTVVPSPVSGAEYLGRTRFWLGEDNRNVRGCRKPRAAGKKARARFGEGRGVRGTRGDSRGGLAGSGKTRRRGEQFDRRCQLG
jgi:hypothetical protein